LNLIVVHAPGGRLLAHRNYIVNYACYKFDGRCLTMVEIIDSLVFGTDKVVSNMIWNCHNSIQSENQRWNI